MYNLSLITHGLECAALSIAITLDSQLEGLVPVAIIHGDIHGTLIIDISKVLVFVRAFCIYGISFLYLQKIVHGDRTLFTEPGDPIQPVRRGVYMFGVMLLVSCM
jgi:hypothetical protein